MTNIYEFMSNSPWLTFFLALWVVLPLASWPFRLMSRLIRHANIRARGWPPPHLDADGDHKPEPDKDNAS